MCRFPKYDQSIKKGQLPYATMKQILQVVSRSQMLSSLDGFSGYNQVLVVDEDMLKTTFWTKWGTISYKRIHFGLINV